MKVSESSRNLESGYMDRSSNPISLTVLYKVPHDKSPVMDSIEIQRLTKLILQVTRSCATLAYRYYTSAHSTHLIYSKYVHSITT